MENDMFCGKELTALVLGALIKVNSRLPSAIIMILLLLLAGSTFQSSARRALKMWKAENAVRSDASRNGQADVVRAPPAVVGREVELPAASETVPESTSTSEGNEECDDDTPYTHVSFFSDSMTSQSDRTLTRRRPSTLPLPGNVVSTDVSQDPKSPWDACRLWGKFILVWICMILVVAMRGGSGHSIISITSCSWQYWLVTATGFFLLMLVGALTRQPDTSFCSCQILHVYSVYPHRSAKRNARIYRSFVRRVKAGCFQCLGSSVVYLCGHRSP